MKNINYIGYGSEERDEESRYFNFGFRQYDPLTGRFLSPDPLFEKFTFCSPYQYAYNNPVSFKDPTGLAPESEKKKSNKMLRTEIEDIMADLRCVANRFEEFFQWSRSQLYGAMGFHYVSHLNMWTDNPFLFSVGDGSGGQIRLAVLFGSGLGTGFNGLLSLSDDQKKAVEKHIILNTVNVTDNLEMISRFWNAFWVANETMSMEDYNFYTSNYLSVFIFTDVQFQDEVGKLYDGAIGLSTQDMPMILLKESDFVIDENGFTDEPYNDEYYGHEQQYYDPTMIIIHEIGHQFVGSKIADYENWDGVYRENWARWFMNTRYNNRFGKEPEEYKSPLWFTIRRIFGLTNGRNP